MSDRSRFSVVFALAAVLTSFACVSFTGIGLRVAIDPVEPGDDDDLTVLIVTSPVDEAGGTWTYTYAWSVNDEPQPDLTAEVVPATRTELGDTWTVTVTPILDDGTVGTEAFATVVLPPAIEDRDNDGFPADVDCNDNDPNINPLAVESCNGLDDNCSGTADDGTSGDFADRDGDGFDTCSDDGVPGGDGTDCNDQNDDVFPGATPACNGITDDDCDGVDELDEVDNDNDMVTECAGDCDDADPLKQPLDVDMDGTSTCDPVPDCDDLSVALNIDDVDMDGDSTCDGDCDDNSAAANVQDVDMDGVTTCGPDGVFATADDDCNDHDAHNFPGNIEACDNLDNDCDGFAEVGDADVDLDSYTICLGDCDDNNPHVNPGETEVCNGVDDDCANGIDDGFDDIDNDNSAVCLDCDDNEPLAFPGGVEVCDAIDNDCLNGVDDGFDTDVDTVTTCGPDGIPGNDDDDCNDNNILVNPTVTELCDAVDDDCDGTVDNGFDTDMDLFTTCGADGDINAEADNDCDDSLPLTFPGATETIDGNDEDCDGDIDEYTFTQVQTLVFVNSCGCHNGGTHSTGMVGLSGVNGYNNIVSVASSQMPSLNRIEPGLSLDSYLFQKITGTQTTATNPMPNGSPGLIVTSPDHVTGIKNWIDAGAAND
jgi:hypothetical protein